MIFRVSCLSWILLAGGSNAFQISNRPNNGLSLLRSAVVEADETKVETDSTSDLTRDIIGKLRWRELQRELEVRDLSTDGSTAAMRDRLREVAIDFDKAKIAKKDEDECVVDMSGINFVDESDPDFEYKDLIRQVMDRSAQGHWKVASRRLRKLVKLVKNSNESEDEGSSNLCIPPDVYVAALKACSEDRLHGARAAETARKIMELMVEEEYEIPVDLLNSCIRNSIGMENGGLHDGFGGIDTALAMLAAVHKQEETLYEEKTSLVTTETYDAILTALAREGGSDVDDALKLLRSMIVEKSETPLLSTFASVAKAEVLGWKDEVNAVGPEKVFNVLAYVKAAGYELDKIASTEDGRALLASGVIAADRVSSPGVGLRLLKAASQASGCEPDRGDILVSESSPAAQKAVIRVHVRAISAANESGNWKLAVKLLELMLDRYLKPSANVWRSVIANCAKQDKSRKATALLTDWVKLYETGQAPIPPVSVFNTVINACEVCGEEELTVSVLELMKKTHDIDGNVITFNIALKRLAKAGNYWAAEGIIVGMIENAIEPSVVSYTTAIAACAASEEKQPQLANEWLKRMRLMGVTPNVVSYNTMLGACLDGKLESTKLASQVAQEMLNQIDEQLERDTEMTKIDEFSDVLPDFYTRSVARQLMKQLKENWIAGDIDKRLAVDTVRIPLLKLVEFSKSKAAEEAKKRIDSSNKDRDELEVKKESLIKETEMELEYLNADRRTAEV